MSLIIARRTLAAGLLAAVVVASGCGDGGGDEPADAEGLAAAGRSFWEDFVADDVDGMYERLTDECQDEVSAGEFAAQVSLATTFAEAFGLDFAEADIVDVETRDVADGRGELRVVVEVDGEPLDDDESFEPWIHAGGRWRTEECDDEGFFGDEDDGGGADDEEDDDGPSTTIGGDLVPAEEAIESEARSAATSGTVGEPAALGGLSVVVEEVNRSDQAPEDGDVAVLEVVVRVENRSGEEGQVPEVALTCASTGPVEGIAFYDGATLDTWGEVPSGSFQDGTEVLGVPGECDDPRIRVSEPFGDAAVDYEVPAALIG